jgi:hypothetical protein
LLLCDDGAGLKSVIANMRSLAILSLLLFASFPSLGQSTQTPTTLPGSGKKSTTVAGNVIRLHAGEPLKKAGVLLQSHSDEEFSVFSLTDEQGHFFSKTFRPVHTRNRKLTSPPMGIRELKRKARCFDSGPLA